jgi:hypothetical protein
MPKLKDSLLNELREGMFVAVELPTAIAFAKGKIEKIVEGKISSLHAPGQEPRVTPTLISILVPVVIQVHPNVEAVDNLSVLQLPVMEEVKAEIDEKLRASAE